jgi:RNA polymerase sigma-70 factor, ECF subfamily
MPPPEDTSRDASGATAEFIRSTEPYRRELLAHCYRMVGSVADAEDLVQETYLRAWQAFDDYAGVALIRSWLYKIATNVCLTELARRGRRVLPSGLGEPSADWRPAPIAGTGTGWLQPIPDALVVSESADPADVLAAKESLRLALIASLQYLPPRQRAVLILKDVLLFSSAEIAAMLGTTTTSVKSALQRARARLEQIGPTPETVTGPDTNSETLLVERYMTAFERADIAALEQLLVTDVTLEATPLRTWFAGRACCLPYLAQHVLGAPGSWRMLPTHANGRPAAATYRRNNSGGYDAYGIVHLEISHLNITRIVAFGDPSLLPYFGLPPHLPPVDPSPVVPPAGADIRICRDVRGADLPRRYQTAGGQVTS